MRTFQHKVTINDMAAIGLFALAAFFCLWNRTNSLMVILGFILIIVTIRATDRAIHTKYILTDDDILKVNTGRVGRTKTILLCEVKAIEKRPFAFHLGEYALIEMKNGRVVSLQPDNLDSFLSTMNKRIVIKANKQ